jgi:hypothetical protein
MCGAKRNIYGNWGKQLHVESGFFDGFSGSGKPGGYDDIHGSGSERKLHEQCNEDGNGSANTYFYYCCNVNKYLQRGKYNAYCNRGI